MQRRCTSGLIAELNAILQLLECVCVHTGNKRDVHSAGGGKAIVPFANSLSSYIYVRPATRKQPSTRTGRPVPVSDVPNPKKAFFLSYFGYRTPKKSGIRIRQNRTDTGRPIRVLDAFASEIRITANPIFRARLKNSMYLCITCHNRSRGAIIFSVFLILILRTVDFCM